MTSKWAAPRKSSRGNVRGLRAQGVGVSGPGACPGSRGRALQAHRQLSLRSWSAGSEATSWREVKDTGSWKNLARCLFPPRRSCFCLSVLQGCSGEPSLASRKPLHDLQPLCFLHQTSLWGLLAWPLTPTSPTGLSSLGTELCLICLFIP